MTAKKGDNSAKLEAQQRSLFFHHVKKRMAHNSELEAIRKDRSDDAKKAKMDGVTVEEMDFALKAMEMDDTNLPRSKYIKQGKILAWLGLITEFNPDETLADRSPKGERVQAEGELAGGLGLDRQSPYGPGSDDEQNWLQGYDRGKKLYLDNIADALDAADKARATGAAATKNKAKKGGEPLNGDLPPESEKEPDKPALAAPEKPAKPKGGKKPAKPDPRAAEPLAADAQKKREAGADFN